MAARLEEWSKHEVRAVIRFLNARNLPASEIHRQLVEVYGEDVMSRQSVAKWCVQFRSGRVSTDDRERCGRPQRARTADNAALIDNAIRNNRTVTIKVKPCDVFQKDFEKAKSSATSGRVIPGDKFRDSEANGSTSCGIIENAVKDVPCSDLHEHTEAVESTVYGTADIVVKREPCDDLEEGAETVDSTFVGIVDLVVKPEPSHDFQDSEAVQSTTMEIVDIASTQVKIESSYDEFNKHPSVEESMMLVEVLDIVKVEALGHVQEELVATVATESFRNTDIDESEWFWSLPYLSTGSDDLLENNMKDKLAQHSDFSTAGESYLILEYVYPYMPQQDVDELVNQLKPSFLVGLYTKLKRSVLPMNWSILKRKEYVYAAETTDTQCLAVRKSVAIDGNRNMNVYVHNKLVPDVQKRIGLKSDQSLQMSQSLENAVAIITKLVCVLACVNVCCGNFEDICFSAYQKSNNENVFRNGYIEGDYQQVAGNGIRYSRTVRAKNCLFVLEKEIRCRECFEIRKLLNLPKNGETLEPTAKRFRFFSDF